MAFWIFKIAEQELYPDVPGKKYVYDNTHSVRVMAGDVFLYLDKTQKYSFTATGVVRRLTERIPTPKEAQRTNKVRIVFTAHLSDVIWFTSPLTISPLTKEGKRNRARLGIIDVNLLGWSQSIPSLGESMYHRILDLAETEGLVPSVNTQDFHVPDTWGQTKTRGAVKSFSEQVLRRSNSTCIVCGSALPGVVEAAHLSPYASDKSNRANPANGVCLCKYCHRALDLRLIAIQPDGVLLVSPSVSDPIALHHFSQISREQRAKWLVGVDRNFLKLTKQWYDENLSNK
jgi:hypothetical protein